MQTNTSDPTIVVWRINPALQNVLMQFQDIALGQEPRVRVRLMWHKIWTQAGNQIFYLDGQAFGEPGVRGDGAPRIDLIRPSGSGAEASDFESWFYVGTQRATKPPLQVTAVKLTSLITGIAADITPHQQAQQLIGEIIFPLQQAEITFNRASDPKGVTPNNIFVFTMDPVAAAMKFRVALQNLTVNGNTVTLLLANAVPSDALEVAGGVDDSFAPLTSASHRAR